MSFTNSSYASSKTPHSRLTHGEADADSACSRILAAAAAVPGAAAVQQAAGWSPLALGALNASGGELYYYAQDACAAEGEWAAQVHAA